MKRQQECSCGGKEQYSLTQMFQKKALVAKAVAVPAVLEKSPATRVWEGRIDLRTLIHLI